MSKYLVYFINVKTKRDCLNWIVLYKERYYLWKWFIADLSFLGCFFWDYDEELANWKNSQTEIFFDKQLAILLVTTK